MTLIGKEARNTFILSCLKLELTTELLSLTQSSGSKQDSGIINSINLDNYNEIEEKMFDTNEAKITYQGYTWNADGYSIQGTLNADQTSGIKELTITLKKTISLDNAIYKAFVPTTLQKNRYAVPDLEAEEHLNSLTLI